MTDAAVGVAFADGQEWALEEAYRRWGALIHTVAQRATGSPHDADDIAQAVFVSAWRGRHRYSPDHAALPAWLLGITKRRIADHWESAPENNAGLSRWTCIRIGPSRPKTVWSRSLTGCSSPMSSRDSTSPNDRSWSSRSSTT